MAYEAFEAAGDSKRSATNSSKRVNLIGCCTVADRDLIAEELRVLNSHRLENKGMNAGMDTQAQATIKVRQNLHTSWNKISCRVDHTKSHATGPPRHSPEA